MVHVASDVVYDSNHVSGHLLSDQSAGDIQRDGGHRSSHGDTQDRHTATFYYQVDWMDCRWLNRKTHVTQVLKLILNY